MLRNVYGRHLALELTILLAVFALGCQNSVSPTAPAAVEPDAPLVQQSASDLGEGFTFWATVTREPIVTKLNGRTWVELKVSCKQSPMGPESTAYFLCGGRLMQRCLRLSPRDDVFVAGASRMGSIDRTPAWLIPSFRVID